MTFNFITYNKKLSSLKEGCLSTCQKKSKTKTVKKKQKKQERHQVRMENRYPPIRQKRQGQQVSKEVKNYLFETTDLKTTTCI